MTINSAWGLATRLKHAVCACIAALGIALGFTAFSHQSASAARVELDHPILGFVNLELSELPAAGLSYVRTAIAEKVVSHERLLAEAGRQKAACAQELSDACSESHPDAQQTDFIEQRAIPAANRYAIAAQAYIDSKRALEREQQKLASVNAEIKARADSARAAEERVRALTSPAARQEQTVGADSPAHRRPEPRILPRPVVPASAAPQRPAESDDVSSNRLASLPSAPQISTTDSSSPSPSMSIGSESSSELRLVWVQEGKPQTSRATGRTRVLVERKLTGKPWKDGVIKFDTLAKEQAYIDAEMLAVQKKPQSRERRRVRRPNSRAVSTDASQSPPSSPKRFKPDPIPPGVSPSTLSVSTTNIENPLFAAAAVGAQSSAATDDIDIDVRETPTTFDPSISLARSMESLDAVPGYQNTDSQAPFAPHTSFSTLLGQIALPADSTLFGGFAANDLR